MFVVFEFKVLDLYKFFFNKKSVTQKQLNLTSKVR